MFFKKDSTQNEKNFLVKTCALLIHAAKIDENYTEKEKEIIKKTLLELNAKKEIITQIINDAESIEKNSTKTDISFLVKTCALLIHAAKIDENYTEKEEEIIKKTLLELGAKKETIAQIIIDAKSIEENSNQILDFTKEVKNLTETDKIKIIESLWSIIYSNNEADIYETNLMRRLAGLLYIDSSTMGDIKDKIKKENL